MKKLVSVLALAMGLTGCASSLPEAMYTSLAREWVQVDRCNAQYDLGVSDTALYRSVLQRTLNNYKYDPIKLNSEVQWIAEMYPRVSPQECRTLENKVASFRLQQQEAAEQSRQWQEAIDSAAKIGPKNTYCNTIGSMTNCTTH